jgi:hypothetical protein
MIGVLLYEGCRIKTSVLESKGIWTQVCACLQVSLRTGGEKRRLSDVGARGEMNRALI